MLRIIVLICMKWDTPKALALRAIRSTAASLLPDDAILLRVDGGELAVPQSFHMAAYPVPLLVRADPVCSGLAHGLNSLLDEVLEDPTWDLIARMDADDESLPDRMKVQREYFEAHPELDILGTACHELDEHGSYLQLKRMPLTHREIICTFPRSNPLNHPTVMMRRRVFESGLRYREDVRRTEDYHLWISAASQHYVFANLYEPLLNFSRDDHFFRRRGGFHQACADLNVRLSAMRKLRLFGPFNMLWAFFAFLLRLLPGWAQRWLYLRLR